MRVGLGVGELFCVCVLQRFFLTFVCFLYVACSPAQVDQGSLLVVAESSGEYEVYSFASETKNEVTSEKIGYFNTPLYLKPGDYAVIADCSYQYVSIAPGTEVSVKARRVVYKQPQPVLKDAKFSIRCNRYPPSGLGQKIRGRYHLDVLENVDEMLAGLQNIELVRKPSLDAAEPAYEFDLAAVRVSPPSGYQGSPAFYFLTSEASPYTYTTTQKLGDWALLMPGVYRIFLNGTEKVIQLDALEVKDIEASMVSFQMPESGKFLVRSHLAIPQQTVTVNRKNQLSFEKTHLVLPGPFTASVTGSTEQVRLVARPDQKLVKRFRGVVVDSGCAPFEWPCYAQKEVVLHFKGQNHPFYEGRSDTLLLFSAKEVEVGLEGSKGIRRQIPSHKQFSEFTMGVLEVVPRPVYSKDYVTDLLRLDVAGSPFIGFSYDVVPQKITVLSLLTGRYLLSRYTSIGLEGERVQYSQAVQLEPGVEQTVEIPYYVSESQQPRYKKAVEKMRSDRQRRQLGKWENQHLPMF